MLMKQDSKCNHRRIVLISRRPCYPLGKGGAEVSSFLLMEKLSNYYECIIIGVDFTRKLYHYFI